MILFAQSNKLSSLSIYHFLINILVKYEIITKTAIFNTGGDPWSKYYTDFINISCSIIINRNHLFNKIWFSQKIAINNHFNNPLSVRYLMLMI